MGTDSTFDDDFGGARAAVSIAVFAVLETEGKPKTPTAAVHKDVHQSLPVHAPQRGVGLRLTRSVTQKATLELARVDDQRLHEQSNPSAVAA